MLRCPALLILSVAMFTAKYAQADDFCAALTQVGNGAQSKFREFRDGSDGLGDYKSSVVFPGAETCYIQREGGNFNCKWRLGVESDAGEAAKTMGEGIAACFPLAIFKESKQFSTVARYKYIVSGVEFWIGVDDKRNTVRLHITRRD